MRVILVLALLGVHAGVLAGRQAPTSSPAPATRPHSLQAAGTQSGAASAELMANLLAEGAEVYGIDCMECHADGGMGPTLAANSRLSNKDLVVKAILLGVSEGDMPAFGPTLTDHQIAAVSTYIRNAQDNAHGIVLESDVKRVREASEKK